MEGKDILSTPLRTEFYEWVQKGCNKAKEVIENTEVQNKECCGNG